MSFTESLDTIIEANSNGLLAKHRSWERVRLGDIAKILNGFAFSSSLFSPSKGVPLLRIRDVLDTETEAFYSGEYDPTYLVRPGELVVGMDGDFHCALWRGPDAVLNQRVCKITPNSEFYRKRFLSFVLPGYLSAINAETSSVTVKHLSSRTVEDIPLPLPPVAEQERIADDLDARLSDLDAAVAALKRVQANLKRYRASVLKAACEGRLVPTEAELARKQRRTYETGEQLLARILKERRAKWESDQLAKMLAAGKPPKNDDWKKKYNEPAPPDTTNLPELPEGWTWANIEQINPGDRPCAYGVLQPGNDVPGGVPFVRVGDLDDGYVDELHLKRIATPIANKYPRTKLHGGEVLLAIVGATIGKTAVVPSSLAGANSARAIAVIPITDCIRPRWVELWFRNPSKVAEMRSLAHEVARQTLNLEDVRASAVALPPINEQARMIDDVEQKLSAAKATLCACELQIRKADRLRQSILKRAFEGKLVPQDPNDEPASVLLERIRAERTANVNGNGRRNGNVILRRAKAAKEGQ